MVAEKASLGTKDHRDHQKPISSDISTSKDPAQNRNSKKYQIPGCTLEHVLSPKQRLPWYSTLSSTRCATLGVSRCIALVERSMMLAVFTAQLRQVFQTEAAVTASPCASGAAVGGTAAVGASILAVKQWSHSCIVLWQGATVAAYCGREPQLQGAVGRLMRDA